MARKQPGVAIGDATYCAVSGVVFVVEDSTPTMNAGGRTFYFCCDSCREYFESHTAEVLSKRGWA